MVVNIPYRYDLDKASVTNLEIQAFNINLNEPANLFIHVPIVEIDSNRKYFTRHGMHLNNAGKEWLLKLIATKICKLVKNNNRDKPVIILNWKDESSDKKININDNRKSNMQKTVDVPTKVKVSLNQNNN